MANAKSNKRRKQLIFGASVLALGAWQSALAQSVCGDGTTGPICAIDNDDELGQINGTNGTLTSVVNTGEVGDGIAQGGSFGLVVDNRADGVINGGSRNAILGQPRLIFGVTNAGSINGNVVLNDAPAATPFTGALLYYISDGGTLNGNLQLGTNGFSTAYFLQRGADDGVTGTIAAGQGIDVYAKRYSQSGSVALGEYAKPASFEIDGYEVLGTGTTLTLTGEGTTINLGGNGHVINTATIGRLNPTGLYPNGITVVPGAISYAQFKIAPFQTSFSTQAQPVLFFTAGYGDALSSFTNRGEIEGDVRIATQSFVNEGDIHLISASPGTVIHTGADRAFTFNNSGLIDIVFDGQRPTNTMYEAEFDEGTDAAVRLRSAIDTTAAAAVSIINSGEIVGGLDGQFAATTFDFRNSGDISGYFMGDDYVSAVKMNIGELDLVVGPDARDEFNAISANFTNTSTGNIIGGANLIVAADAMTFENAGLIEYNRGNGYALGIEHELLSDDEGELENTPELDAASFAFRNSGTITGATVFDLETSSVSIINTGAMEMPAIPVDADNYFDYIFGEPLALDVGNETSGNQVFTFNNSGSIISRGAGASAVALEIEAGDEDFVGPTASANVNVINSGTIAATGGASRVAGQLIGITPTLINPVAGLFVDASDVTGTSTITIDNQAGGVISVGGNVKAMTPTGYSEIANTDGRWGVALGASGQYINIINAGRIQGGAGTSLPIDGSVIFDDLDLPDNFLAGAIQTIGDGYDPSAPEDYVGSIDHVKNLASGVITGSIDLGANDDIVENYGSITGNVYLRSGDDTFIQSLLGSYDGIADGGDGFDTLIFDITGAVYTGVIDPTLRAKFISFELEKVTGTGQIISEDEVVIGEGETLTLTEGTEINVGVGNTAISGSANTGEAVSNSGSITGNVDMQGGDNTIANLGSITGNVLAGDGDNTFTNGADATLNGDIIMGAGANEITNQGTITGGVTLSNGGNTFANSGAVAGDIVFGNGNNQLILTGDWSLGGAVTGGTGTDVVDATFSSAPVNEADLPILDLSGFEAFEQFNVNGGTGKIGGTATFEEIAINNGRLIGAAGSEINADVTVGSGATFGSAGTVVGDITVGAGGTLSPGASPAVMVEVGNQLLMSGSSAVFEFVPVGQSDQILIDGKLKIESGVTLNITGSRPLTPGIAYDMIVTTEGIDGKFVVGTWDRSAVQGFLRYTTHKLQLLGTFVSATAASEQTEASIGYVNDLLVGGTASTALLNAVPTLLDANGFANAAAFSRLNGEAYASAAQLGVEQGLGLAKSLRDGTAAAGRSDNGLYSFAQFFGDWRTLKGDATVGTSQAKSHSYGALGGIVVGNADASVSAFVGYTDSRQKIAGLDARTDADGVFVGVAGHLATGAADFSVVIAHDWSNGETDRATAGTARVAGKYDLNSFLLDATAGYNIDAGGGIAIRPEVGLTHVSTRRGAVEESGSAVFGLAVARERLNATFIDGTVAVRGGQNDGARVQPWLKGGLRYQMSGRASEARAGFIGSGTSFAVSGVERDKVLPVVGAGFTAKLTPKFTLLSTYEAEFGDGNGHHAKVGVRFAF